MLTTSKKFTLGTKKLIAMGAVSAMSTLAAFASNPAFAADTETTPAVNAQLSDYATGQKWVDAKEWTKAAAAFKRATAADPKNADAWNMLGFSSRWAGDYQGAFAAYDQALKLNPNHRGAHSYLGVAYVKTNDMAKAQAQLAKVESLCGNKTCDEYKLLAGAIAAR
jgi:Flp pilus assembly protein TadD